MVAPRSGGVLLFSGQIIDNSARPADPLWQWNGRAWRALQAGPENRTLPAAAYDTDRDTLVVFGGSAVGSDDRFNETWPRDHHALVEDSGGNVLMYGRGVIVTPRVVHRSRRRGTHRAIRAAGDGERGDDSLFRR